MTRLPVAAFVALVIATVGAFFVTQHLKVTTPLLAGFPAPVPSTINPVSGGTCRIRAGKGRLRQVNFRQMKVSFYLLRRADDVDVYIERDGVMVRQIGTNVHMTVKHRHEFTWNGRLTDGRVASDGQYTIQVSLVHQGRSLPISNSSGALPVTVQTGVPRIVVTGVSPRTVAPGGRVTIRYAGNQGLRPRVLIYRLFGSRPRQVKSYSATSRSGVTGWDGTVAGGRLAPAGTYLVALKLTNRACTTGRSPVSATLAPRAVLTVR